MPKQVSQRSVEASEREELSDSEKEALDRTFERALEDTRELDTETLQEKYREYSKEIKVAAEVARHQLPGTFGGFNPEIGNEFAMDWLDSSYFGLYDWDNGSDASSDTTTDWIHANSGDALSGTGGNPVTVGNDAVHIILGVGSYAQSPKAQRVRFDVNDQPRAVLNVDRAFRETDMQVQWLDAPILLKKNDDLYGQFYAGVGGSEALHLEGVSFIAGKNSKTLDPDNFADSSTLEGNVVVEG